MQPDSNCLVCSEQTALFWRTLVGVQDPVEIWLNKNCLVQPGHPYRYATYQLDPGRKYIRKIAVATMYIFQDLH